MSSRPVILTSLFSIACMAALVSLASADDAAKSAVINPEQAGADFKVQGEYSGTLSVDGVDEKWGVQVVALGDGKFRAVAYPGGLPGDGWVGDVKLTTEGETEDGATRFVTDQAIGVVRDGKVRIEDFDGNEVGVLEKVTRKSPTLGKKPTEDAIVLFDGSSAAAFEGGKLTEEGWLEQGVTSQEKFGDFKLHLEFMLSYMPQARGQGRSNSGCYMQGRYEVQILDSFGLEGEDNECGGIYAIKRPDVNMCYPPLTWQTYDVEFTAPRYDGDEKTANARMTVKHNGVLIHDDVEVPEATRAAPLAEGPEPGPLYIQDHGNPLRFRNIWIIKQ